MPACFDAPWATYKRAARGSSGRYPPAGTSSLPAAAAAAAWGGGEDADEDAEEGAAMEAGAWSLCRPLVRPGGRLSESFEMSKDNS